MDILSISMEMAKRADERVISAICDRMLQKEMPFEIAFNDAIKKLRKGMDEERKKNLYNASKKEAKEWMEYWGKEFLIS